MKRTGKLAHIRQLCCIGLPAEALMPALLRAIREYVPAESAGFFWVDAKGDMTNLYADRMLPPGKMRAYFERHYDGAEHPFRHAFLSRAANKEAVTSVSPTAELTTTAYYQEILKELDAHHVLYAIVRDHGHALGQLSLYRSRRAAAFSAADRSAIADIIHYVSHAVSRPREMAADTEFVDGDAEGMLICDFGGRIVEAGAKSLHLMSMAAQREFSRHSPPLTIGDALPDPARQLLGQFKRALQGERVAAPRVAAEGAWGRFLISAYALDDDHMNAGGGASRAAIHIRRQQPMILKLAEAMGTFDISPQQREVALLLAQGKSNQEIGAALNVTSNTVNYHIKQLFMRLDAHDRATAVGKLLGGRA